MKLKLCIALLFALSFTAEAIASNYECAPYSFKAKNTEAFTVPQSLSALIFNLEDAGGGITWFCDQKYYWVAQKFVGWLPNADLLELKMFSSKSDAEKIATLDKWTKVSKPKEDDPVYGPLVKVASLQIAATRPDPIPWAVAKSGTAKSRPVYLAEEINGKWIRNTSAYSSIRVAINAACDTTKLPLFEEPVTGSDSAVTVYALVSDHPNAGTGVATIPKNVVAVCVRQ